MPNLIIPALDGRPLTIFGDGEQVMDMIYVSDVAEVLCRALLDDHGTYRSVIDAGTGRETTVNDLAKAVLSAIGEDYLEGHTVNHVPMRAGEPEHSVVLGDPSTLTPLGMGPDDFLTLEEGLKLTIASYEE
jgi:nucleoside-diphosphate-sugar epimerase